VLVRPSRLGFKLDPVRLMCVDLAAQFLAPERVSSSPDLSGTSASWQRRLISARCSTVIGSLWGFNAIALPSFINQRLRNRGVPIFRFALERIGTARESERSQFVLAENANVEERGWRQDRYRQDRQCARPPFLAVDALSNWLTPPSDRARHHHQVHGCRSCHRGAVSFTNLRSDMIHSRVRRLMCVAGTSGKPLYEARTLPDRGSSD
jgi:hypothetical protein